MRNLTPLLVLAAPAIALFVCSPAGCGGPSAPIAAPGAAASSSASESPAASTSAAASSAPAACIPAAQALAPLAHVELKDDALLVCLGGAADATAPCLSVDPRTGKSELAPAWTRPAKDAEASTVPAPEKRRGAFDVSSTAVELSVCKAGTSECHTVKPGYPAQPGVGFGEDYKSPTAEKSTTLTRKFHAAASDDGKRVFVLAAELAKNGNRATPSAWKVYGDTFDVETGKRLSHVPLVSDGGSSNAVADLSSKWQVTWLGERIWLAGFDPRSAASAQELLDPAAGTLLDLGDPSFFVKVGDLWVDGLAKSGGDVVKVVEPRSLSNLGKFSLPGAGSPTTAPSDALRAVPRADGTVWIAFANPPGALALNPAKRESSPPVLLPICP